MAQPSKEPCKKEACDIQACLSKNLFDSKRCLKVIQSLQFCCEQCHFLFASEFRRIPVPRPSRMTLRKE